MPTGKMSKQQAIEAAKKEASAKAAKKVAKVPKAKKPAAKSKPKTKPAKASQKTKALTVKQTPEILSPEVLARRSEEADRILHDEIPKEMAALEGGRAALHQKVQDAIERELWRWCSTPFKSWSAYVKDLQTKAGKKIGTLFNAVGLLRALPGESAESRAAIPARNAQKIKQLKKAKEAKGDKTPVSKKVVEAAKKQKPDEFDKTLKNEGFEAPKGRNGKTPKEDKPDPLLFNEKSGGDKFAGFGRGHADVVSGGSGEVEGAHASAGQYSSIVEQAIEAACAIHKLADKAAGLKLICGEWMNSVCASASGGDQESFLTNLEAADKIRAGV